MSEELAGWLVFMAGIVLIVFGFRILRVVLGETEDPVEPFVLPTPRMQRRVKRRRVIKVEPYVQTVPAEQLHPLDREAWEEAKRALEASQ